MFRVQAAGGALGASGSRLAQVLEGGSNGGGAQLYLADTAALRGAGGDQWQFAPADSQSALAVRIAPSTAGGPLLCLGTIVPHTHA